MYQLVATVYELAEYDRANGELWHEREGKSELLASAHVMVPRADDAGYGTHEQIMSVIRTLCAELAQNSDDALF
jgi:hypothetical protein